MGILGFLVAVKVLGVVKDSFNLAAKQALVDRAFLAGQNGDPPPQASNPELQPMFDSAYEMGQRSIVAKLARKLDE